MKAIQNPCESCKKKGSCPRRCYPRMDYERAVKRRKKQIEEMAIIISHSIQKWANDLPPISCPVYNAENLYNAGYRKQSENILELPCKVGDKVYQTDGVRIYESTINEITLTTNKMICVTENIAFDETAIGKGIFLTKEEAEAKMKGGAE